MHLMRDPIGLLAFTLLAACWFAPARAQDRSLAVLFGPAGAEVSRQAAHTAASTARHWLKDDGAAVEIWRAGKPDGLEIPAGVSSKELERAFADAARDSRESAPATFIDSLDASAQALARRPGIRLLAAILENRPLSGESESALKQIVEFCQSHLVRVLVLVPSEGGSKIVNPAWKTLAEQTGGLLARDIKALETNVMLLAPSKRNPQNEVQEQAAHEHSSPDGAAPASTDAQAQTAGYQLPVHTRFVRTSSGGIQTFGTQKSFTSGGSGGPGGGSGGVTTNEGGPNMEGTTGPIRGLLIVESPLNALKFQIDDHAGTYLARARVTQIARNAKGQAAWVARKEVTFRGPLHKMEARRAGTLFYMREVQLPAAQYMLEATVEDLIAGSSGTVRESLRTGAGIPGFTISDALFVRPYKGSSDRIEADMVFSYDGNAIAPMLNPVFKANEPFDLQLYLVIYPDLLGGQPELSLEILRNGKVVGRTPLPFNERLRDEARMGTGGQRGEQKHQFPFMATLKGAKLSPGEFEARVTVRQNNNVLTRSVTFRVLGAGPAIVESAGGPSAPQAAAEEDLSEVVLPEVDPVAIDSGGGALPDAEQQRLWEEAAAAALGYAAHLPNFRCNQETRRLSAPVKDTERLHEGDVYIEELTYENGKESYRTLEFNGLKADRTRGAMRGIHSRGEFGTMLRSLFSAEVGIKYKWAGRAMAGGALCEVFEIEVPVEKSNFVMYFNTRQEVAGYTGRVFIDDETGLVRRLIMSGTGLPKDFGLQSPSFSLEYGMVRVGSQDYLLPLRSVLQVRQGRSLVRNEAVFRDYRKFEASSEIKFNN